MSFKAARILVLASFAFVAVAGFHLISRLLPALARGEPLFASLEQTLAAGVFAAATLLLTSVVRRLNASESRIMEEGRKAAFDTDLRTRYRTDNAGIARLFGADPENVEILRLPASATRVLPPIDARNPSRKTSTKRGGKRGGKKQQARDEHKDTGESPESTENLSPFRYYLIEAHGKHRNLWITCDIGDALAERGIHGSHNVHEALAILDAVLDEETPTSSEGDVQKGSRLVALYAERRRPGERTERTVIAIEPG